MKFFDVNLCCVTWVVVVVATQQGGRRIESNGVTGRWCDDVHLMLVIIRSRLGTAREICSKISRNIFELTAKD